MGADTTLRPAEPRDIAGITDLLAATFRAPIARHQWNALFQRPWGDAGGDGGLGYLLEVRGRIVGYLGAIYARRMVDQRERTFVNHTTWCVAPEFRFMAAALPRALLRQANCVHTNLTPRPDVEPIYRSLKFTSLTSYMLVVPSFVPTTRAFGRARALTRPADLRGILTAAQLQVLQDHAAFPVRHYVIATNNDYAYVVTRRRQAWGIGASQLLHCSNPRLLGRHLEILKLAMLRHEFPAALIIDPRFISPIPRLAVRFPRAAYYRGEGVRPDTVDYLYSEFVLLPI